MHVYIWEFDINTAINLQMLFLACICIAISQPQQRIP